jgi:hypothetical protein
MRVKGPGKKLMNVIARCPHYVLKKSMVSDVDDILANIGKIDVTG